MTTKRQKTTKKETPALTLGHIWQAQQAWLTLMGMKKSVKVSYKLARYFRDVIRPELKTIDEERNALIERFGTKNAQGVPEIKPDTEAMKGFIEDFNNYLTNAPGTVQADMTMDELVKGIEAFKDNVISEQELLVLEPFFKEGPQKS